MSQDHVAVEIRDAFDSSYVASPGLEDRVISAIPWERPSESASSMPRLAGPVAAAIALLAVGILLAPTLLSKLNLQFPGITAPEAPAYSLAAVSGDSVFVVQRGGITARNRQPGNVLLQSRDEGRSWSDRLHFPGVYDGMQMFGSDGFIWTIDMTMRGCDGAGRNCTGPSDAVTAYRTADGGSTWVALPVTTFPVEDVFFLDATHGWADSGGPTSGLGAEVLYETTDGGTSWSRVGALPHASPMGYVYGVGNYRVTFSRLTDVSLLGWYVGATQLFMTADKGASWRALTLTVPAAVAGWTSTPSQPSFTRQEGVLPIAYHDPKGPDNATANHIYLYVSHDGGATWGDPRSAPAGFAPFGDDLSISILDSRHIWLTSLSLSGGDNVQAGPAVARSSDGGLTWTVAKPAPRILQMSFADPTHGYALDVTGIYNVNGILSTSDGGTTWQRVAVPIFPAG
ncbi:MAG TPA: sialidase family protein [Candidatus Dormibacteraeota bacterium]|nr:sialidase family protein [Candidatus Dormibacteraeota bacterium]